MIVFYVLAAVLATPAALLGALGVWNRAAAVGRRRSALRTIGGAVVALSLGGCAPNIQPDVGPILCTWNPVKGDYDCFTTHDAGAPDAPVCFVSSDSNIQEDPTCTCSPMTNGSPDYMCCCP